MTHAIQLVMTSMRQAAKGAALRVPRIRAVVRERDELRREVAALRLECDGLRRSQEDAPQGFPPGHFYSPVPSLREVRRRAADLFDRTPRSLPGIDLRTEAQLRLLRDELLPMYAEIPWGPTRTEGLRYYFDNPAYSYSDGIFLYSMLRNARPKRIVEVGSGYSSCVTLDTNELFLGGSASCTFVEPYPELLLSLMRPGDRERVTVIPRPLQEVELGVFRELERNDVLFIDSTHVSKIGADVNRIFFEILPALAPGVLVHFHDVFYPFEYPEPWVFEGRQWQEAYLLRSFLEFNSSFEIVFFNTLIQSLHPDFFEAHMPLCLRNPGGSIWLRRKG